MPYNKSRWGWSGDVVGLLYGNISVFARTDWKIPASLYTTSRPTFESTFSRIVRCVQFWHEANFIWCKTQGKRPSTYAETSAVSLFQKHKIADVKQTNTFSQKMLDAFQHCYKKHAYGFLLLLTSNREVISTLNCIERVYWRTDCWKSMEIYWTHHVKSEGIGGEEGGRMEYLTNIQTDNVRIT